MIMLAAFAFALTCTPHVAQASYLEKFIGVISQGTAAEKICRKASFFGGVFSIYPINLKNPILRFENYH